MSHDGQQMAEKPMQHNGKYPFQNVLLNMDSWSTPKAKRDSSSDDYGDRRVVHSIRHSCISEMISKTSNHVLVQQIVGHEHSQSLGITARYTHRVPLSELINVIDNLKWLYCLRWLAFRHACCLYPNRALWLLLPEI